MLKRSLIGVFVSPSFGDSETTSESTLQRQKQVIKKLKP